MNPVVSSQPSNLTIPIVAIQPDRRDDLKVGAAIVARGKATDVGAFAARSIAVGVDGVVPLM